MDRQSFYYAGSFNLDQQSGGHDHKGAQLAREVIPRIELTTGWRCTSRWPWSVGHEVSEYKLTMATTDTTDLARAENFLAVPMTQTSRGCHVEMGMALALDKPSWLYRRPGIQGTSFDTLFKPFPLEWSVIVDQVFDELFKPNVRPSCWCGLRSQHKGHHAAGKP